jgi:hypothetical protein
LSGLDYRTHAAERHRTISGYPFFEPLALASIDHPRGDGFVYPDEAAEAMGVSEREVLQLVREGALVTRGPYVRPALIGWVRVRGDG